jgi:hypothetical protein
LLLQVFADRHGLQSYRSASCSEAYMNRTERRAVRRLLRDQTCGACGQSVDEQAHEAHLIGPHGQRIAHLICLGCFEQCASEEGRRAVAARARLALAPTEGVA